MSPSPQIVYGMVAGSIGYNVGSHRSSTNIGNPSVSVERGLFASNKPFSISADTVSRARRAACFELRGKPKRFDANAFKRRLRRVNG